MFSPVDAVLFDAVGTLIRNLFLAHTAARAAIKHHFPDAQVGSNPLPLGLPPWLQAKILTMFGPGEVSRLPDEGSGDDSAHRMLAAQKFAGNPAETVQFL